MMSAEEIYSKVKCLRGSKHIDMYITTNRIIIAKIGSNLGWTLAFGVVGTYAAQRSADKKSAQLSQLTPESILKADKHNYEILNNEITQIEIKKPGAITTGKISIKTTYKTHKFVFKTKEEYNNNIDLFTRLFGSRLITI